MNDFEPGEGWREMRKGERDQDEMIVHYGDEGSTTWVREVPVLALPTEFGTVIKIGAWRFVLMDAIDACAWFLLCPNTREAAASMNRANVRAGAGYSPEFVRVEAEQHGGFEVLAEPPHVPDKHDRFAEQQRDAAIKARVRRETAKAVLDRVREQAGRYIPKGNIIAAADEVAREFGAGA